MTRPTDITGMKFERLTVIKRNGQAKNGKTKTAAWLCKCDCGKIVTVEGRAMIRGNTKSCGCYGFDKRMGKVITHGMSETPLHKLWRNIKKRCNPNVKKSKEYNCYAHIRVCEEWESFECFYGWAKDKWKRGLTIDRIDNTKNYHPANCRFVPNKINAQNKSVSKYWFVYGKRFESCSDAASFWGLSKATIRNMCFGRMYNGGKFYPPEQHCYAIGKYNA